MAGSPDVDQGNSDPASGRNLAQLGIGGTMKADQIRGKTLRWTFDDGPTKGKTFEHTFGEDGSVTYRMAGSPKATKEDHYELAQIGDDVCTVSYLAKTGWTLTVVLDFKSHEA